MNTFPSTLIQGEGSTEEWYDPVLVSVARSGAVHTRRLQSGKKRRFHITHHQLSSALKGTFQTFYDANRSVPFLFPWVGDGVTYTVMFIGTSVRFKPTVSLLWEIEFDIVEG